MSFILTTVFGGICRGAALTALQMANFAGRMYNGWSQRQWEREKLEKELQFQKTQDELKLQFQKAQAEQNFQKQAQLQRELVVFQQQKEREQQIEIEQIRQQLQKAQAERNFQFQSQLQRELVGLQLEKDLRLQKNRFEWEEARWEKEQFVQNVWPLLDTPRGFIERLERFNQPMSIILSGSLENQFRDMLQGVASFFNDHYTAKSHVFYYNQGWKPEMAKQDGNAQCFAIHDVLCGRPTLVLLPDVQSGVFTLSMAFWGWGDMQMPQTVRVFQCNLKEIEVRILRQKALEWKVPFPPNPQGRMKAIQNNQQVAHEEEIYRQQLEDAGCSTEEIKQYCFDAFESRYEKTGLEGDIRRELNQAFAIPIELTGAMFSDAYNVGCGFLPKLPSVLKQFPEEVRKEYMPQAGDFFWNMTENIQDEINKPLMWARIAEAFRLAGETEIAQRFYTNVQETLCKNYADPKTPYAPEHNEALKLIKSNPQLDVKKLPAPRKVPKEPKPKAPAKPQSTSKVVPKEESPAKSQSASKAVPKVESPTKPQSTHPTTVHKAGVREVKRVDGIEYAFRWCPAGTFMMGSPSSEFDRDNDETQHQVTLTKGFWMLETEVTQAMWRSVMGNTPSEFRGDTLPVEKVSWYDCEEFCWILSDKIGLMVSLPTEAQWEYACRAGTTTRYYWGDDEGLLYQYGNYCNRSSTNGLDWQDNTHDDGYDKTAPVRSYKPNAWGLYDMSGNVWEWCADQYGGYPSGAVTDPMGPISGSYYVIRGGSWFNSAGSCRSAYRSNSTPDCRLHYLGFRVIACPDQ